MVLVTFYFIYFLLRIDPRLIYQAQEPVFFFDRYFIGEFFSYPGGVNELVCGFLSQFFYYSWTGALLLVLVFVLIAWNAKLLIRSVGAERPVLYLHWLPSILLLALHSNYRFPLVLTLGLLWSLLGVNVYIRLAASNRAARVLLYVILQIILYHVTAGQVCIFSVVVILYEVLHRRIGLVLLYIVFAGLLPYVGASTLFILRVQDAYTMHLNSYGTYKVMWLSWVLYAFFPIVLLVVTFERKYARAGSKGASNIRGRLASTRSIPVRLIQGVLILAVAVTVAVYSYDRSQKAFLLIDRHARFGEWEKVLDMAREGLPSGNIIQCQVNRALYHCGRLCDRMFGLPQRFGVNGLFMHDSLRPAFPLQHSDVFFDLGLVNEAEHWACEAVAVRGDTPWNLQRLAQVNLLEGNRDAAAKYLGMLQKTMWHRTWAAERLKYLSDGNDPGAAGQLQDIRKVMPKADFLLSPTEPERCLEELLKNSANKMAFEYFMACCLLKGDISRFMKYLPRLNDFDYTGIPRHFEEAMLIYMQLAGRKDIALPGKEISQQTIRRFNEFNQIVARYEKNKAAAYNELKKYRDTYWFYGLYYYETDE